MTPPPSTPQPDPNPTLIIDQAQDMLIELNSVVAELTNLLKVAVPPNEPPPSP